MIELQEIQIAIHAGRVGPEYECFGDNSSSRGGEKIRGETGSPICPRLKIGTDFKWDGADLLSVKAQLGAPDHLKEIHIFRPPVGESLEIDLEKWNVWKHENREWHEACFEFCDLKYVDGDVDRWTEAKRSHTGTITISIQRMAIVKRGRRQWPLIQFEPILEVPKSSVFPGGIEHAIQISYSTKVNTARLYDLWTATKLEGASGNYFMFRFQYRSEAWLRKLSIQSLEPSGYLTKRTFAEISPSSQKDIETVEDLPSREFTNNNHRRSNIPYVVDEDDEEEEESLMVLSQLAKRSATSKAPAKKAKALSKPETAPRKERVVSSPTLTENLNHHSDIGCREQNVDNTRLFDSRNITPSTASPYTTFPVSRTPMSVLVTDPITRAERLKKLKEEEEVVDELLFQHLTARKAKIRREVDQLESMEN